MQQAAPTKVENARLEMTQDRLLVRPAPEETMSPGGIMLPNMARGRPTIGEVVAVGPGRRSPEGKLIELGYEEGDQVIFGVYSGTEVEVNGEVLLILKEPDIYAIVRPLTEEEKAEAASAREALEKARAEAEPQSDARTPGKILLAEKRTNLVLP